MTWPPGRLVLLAAVASFCANWSFAFQITYVNTSVDTFYNLANQAYATANQCSACKIFETRWLTEWSIIVSSFYPGTIGGFLAVPLLTSLIGVKRSLGLMCAIASLGVLVHFAVLPLISYGEQVFTILLVVGRFLIGLQAGSSLCLLPLYIIEISPPKHRALFNSFQQVSQSFATLLGLVLGSEEIVPLKDNRFLVLQIFSVLPVLVVFVMLVVTPATPTYIAEFQPGNRSYEKASLKFYYGEEKTQKPSYKRYSLTWSTRSMSLDEDYVSPQDSSWKKSIKGFLIGAVVAVSYAFTGDDLIDTFSTQMLVGDGKATSQHQTTDVFARLVSVALGVVLFIASIFGVFLVDRYGRRNLVLIGLIGTCAANLAAAVFSANKIFVSVCFAATKMFIGLGCGGPAWFLTSELVRPEHAWIFQPISTGVLLASTMLETFFFLPIDAALGNYSLLILTASPAFFSAVIIFLFLPETKGRTTEEIQLSLSSHRFSGLQRSQITSSNGYGTFFEEQS